jgi:hypothetical protein
VNNDRPRYLRDAPEHGIAEVPVIGAGAGAVAPEFGRELPVPLTVIENEFLDVLTGARHAQQKVVEHGVVQHGDARPRERTAVDPTVQAVIAEVVEAYIRIAVTGLHTATMAKRAEESGGVIGDSCPGRR